MVIVIIGNVFGVLPRWNEEQINYTILLELILDFYMQNIKGISMVSSEKYVGVGK